MSFGMFPVAGKRGKRRSCQLREWTANERNNGATPAFIWGDDARGRLVDPAAAGFHRIIDFHRLLHLGGVSGKRLFLRQLRFTVLFAGTVRRFAAQLVWAETRLVAAVASIFAGAFYSLGTRWLPAHLLLLSWRLLQSVLGRSAGMHCRRATQKLLGRAFIPADHAERASVFPLSGALVHFDSGV